MIAGVQQGLKALAIQKAAIEIAGVCKATATQIAAAIQIAGPSLG